MKSKTIYELKRVTSPNEAIYLEGLSIYAKETFPGEKTDTNEITYWLENYNKQFNDRFYIFVFLKDGVTIGYTQFVYFQQARILFFDYLTIRQEFRGGNTFFEFFAQIRNYLTSIENLDISYVLVDITYRDHGSKPSSFTILFVRLLKIYGFGVIKFNYQAPMLGHENHESQMTSVFMVHCKEMTNSLRTETYKQFVRTVYYDHYIRWYTPFIIGSAFQEYKEHIDRLFYDFSLKVDKKDTIEINGHLDSLMDQSSAPVDTLSPKRILGYGIIFLLLFAFIGAALYGLKIYLALSETLVWTIFIFSLISFLVLTAIFSDRSKGLLIRILDKIIP